MMMGRGVASAEDFMFVMHREGGGITPPLRFIFIVNYPFSFDFFVCYCSAL